MSLSADSMKSKRSQRIKDLKKTKNWHNISVAKSLHSFKEKQEETENIHVLLHSKNLVSFS